MKKLLSLAAAASLTFSLFGVAGASTISKNLPAPVNQAFQGAGHVANEAGRPIHNATKDLGHDLEGGHDRRVRRHYRSSYYSSRRYGRRYGRRRSRHYMSHRRHHHNRR